MIYKVKGTKLESELDEAIREDGVKYHWLSPPTPKQIYYIEAPSMQKALTKAKKVLNNIYFIKQEDGEILYEYED